MVEKTIITEHKQSQTVNGKNFKTKFKHAAGH